MLHVALPAAANSEEAAPTGTLLSLLISHSLLATLVLFRVTIIESRDRGHAQDNQARGTAVAFVKLKTNNL